jgi:hypothetical protein
MYELADLGAIECSEIGTHVVVYWRGPAPAAVRAEADDPAQAVAVELRECPYTHSQLKAGVEALAQASDADLGAELVSVGPAAGASGIELRVIEVTPVVRARATKLAGGIRVDVSPGHRAVLIT